jgi:hypothetical protein
VSSVRDELRREVPELRRALKAKPPPPAETRAVIEKLREKADRVIHLRTQAFSEDA